MKKSGITIAEGDCMRRRLLAICVLLLQCIYARAELPFVRDGEAGFVVSHIDYGLSADANTAVACPEGMSLSLQEVYALAPEGQRQAGEPDEEYMARLSDAARRLGSNDEGLNFCMNPEAAPRDEYFRVVQSSTMPVSGIDLDGEDSANDFRGIDGAPGVDNQWYRVAGCSRSWQPNGQSNSYNIGMLTGSWGILFKLEGVDNLRNDDAVEVHLYANTDPIRLSPARVPVAYATYIATDSPRYRASTSGRIVDGVLTSEPVDVSFLNEVNSMYLDRPLRDARLQVSLAEDGTVSGYLSGYTPVEAMYDMQYGYRDGVTAAGELAPFRLRSGSANGAAFVLGHTCAGAYQALHKLADGHPDPDSGQYTSISTQYRIEAIPAFVIDTAVGESPLPEVRVRQARATDKRAGERPEQPDVIAQASHSGGGQ